MFNFFRKRNAFDDEKKAKFVDAIASMLEVQMAFVPGQSVEDESGEVNPKAIGYIYGFIDAALQTIGQDMSDQNIGIPITFRVLGRLFPGREQKYLSFLADRRPRPRPVDNSAERRCRAGKSRLPCVRLGIWLSSWAAMKTNLTYRQGVYTVLHEIQLG